MSCKFELSGSKRRRLHRSQSAYQVGARSASPSNSVFDFDDEDSLLKAECRLLQDEVSRTHKHIKQEMSLTNELASQNTQLELNLNLYLKREAQMKKTIQQLMREHLQSVGLMSRQIQHRQLEKAQRKSQCTQLTDLYSSLQQFKKKILAQESLTRSNFTKKSLQIQYLKAQREELERQLFTLQNPDTKYKQLIPATQSVSRSSSLVDKVEIQHMLTQAQ